MTPDKYERDNKQVTGVSSFWNIRKNNETEKIGLVTPTHVSDHYKLQESTNWVLLMPCIHASLPRILMSVMTSQTTGNVTACSTVCSVQHRRKHQSCALLALCGESPVTGGFPSQRASNADSASMSWRHHVHDATQLGMNIHSICFPVNCINGWSLNQHKYPFRLIWRVTYRIHILNVKYATDDTFKLQYVYAWWYASHFAGHLDKMYDDIVGVYIEIFNFFVNFEASGLNYKKTHGESGGGF